MNYIGRPTETTQQSGMTHHEVSKCVRLRREVRLVKEFVVPNGPVQTYKPTASEALMWPFLYTGGPFW